MFYFFFYCLMLTLSKNMVLINHIVLGLFGFFCKQHCNHLIKKFFSFFFFSARGTCHHHRQHCVHGGSAVICFWFLHEINDRLFYQAADIFRRKHSFYFLDGTVLSKSRPQVYHVFQIFIVLKGNNIVKYIYIYIYFCFLLFKKNFAYYRTFQANNNYLLNRLISLCLFNLSVFVNMWSSSLLPLFLPLIKICVRR